MYVLIATFVYYVFVYHLFSSLVNHEVNFFFEAYFYLQFKLLYYLS